MLIKYNGKQYVDLTLFIMANPLPSINLCKVKSTGKVYLIDGDEPLVIDYVVQYDKLKEWNMATFLQLVYSCGADISLETYHEMKFTFDTLTTEVTRELDDIKPVGGDNEV